RVAPRIVGSRGIFFGRSGYYGAHYRPYYSFRPRLSLGFGLWVGYPVAYPYSADPYAYGYAAPSYGYPAPAYPANQPGTIYPEAASPAPGYPPQQAAPSVGVQQGDQESAPGGVSFEITPSTAAVFVDGTYVGTAGTFGPSSQPLGLIAGQHHIEIRAAGYRTMTFDAEVTPGQ